MSSNKLHEITTTISGKNYKYYDIGKGEQTLIFLHGLANSKEGEPHFFEELLENYRCIFLDLPAHNNLSQNNCYCLDDFSNYVCTFVKHLNLKNVALIGFSFGGLVALSAASTLSVPAILWSSPLTLNKRYVTNLALLIMQIGYFLPPYLYKYLAKCALLKKFASLIGIRLSAEDYEALCTFDNTASGIFKKIILQEVAIPKNIPLLFIFGEKDILISSKIHSQLQLPNPKIQRKVIIENGGHFGTNKGRLEGIKAIEFFLTDCARKSVC